jgi:hypothetical protein
MPDQTIKHNNAAPEFLIILIPAAFFAVVLATAWKFILGITLLLTGNSLWQNYQWTKLSQQINPAFSQLVLERHGEVTPLELSMRAKVANRYLNNKAVEFGGVSYQTPNGNQVYSFLTVGTLNRTFADMPTESTLDQKLAAIELAPAKQDSIEVTTSLDSTIAESLAPTVLPEEQKIEPVIELTSPATAPTAEFKVEEAPPEQPQALNVESSTVPTSFENEKTVEPPLVIETPTEIAAAPARPEPEVTAKVEPPTIEPVTNAEGSNFSQALRNIFNNPPASVPEEPVVAAEPVVTETISQADLAKRLDVHASTIYKRRSDVSFMEWTRNRDPEGVAWGYSRETKEFYRIG